MQTDTHRTQAPRPRNPVAFDLRTLPDGLHPDDADLLHGDGVLVEFELTTDPADPTAC